MTTPCKQLTPEKDRAILQFFKRLWLNAPIATIVLVMSLAVAGVLTVRSVAFWKDHHQRTQAIEAWMTPKYIAHSWAVPPEVVMDALGDFKRRKNGPMSLEQIAKAQGVSVHDLILSVDEAVHSFDIMRPPPPPPHAPPGRPMPKDGP